jgi:hypothetical protein
MPSSGRYQSRILSFLSQQRLRWGDRYGQRLRQAKLLAVWTAQIVVYPIYAVFQAGRLTRQQLGQTLRHTHPWLKQATQRAQTSIQVSINRQRSSSPLVSSTPIWHTMQQVQEFDWSVDASVDESTDQSVEHSGHQPGDPALGRPVAIAPEALGRVNSQHLISAQVINEQTINEENRNGRSPLIKNPGCNAIHPIYIQGLATRLTDQKLVLITTENQILDCLTVDQCHELRQRIAFEVAVFYHHWKLEQRLAHLTQQETAPLPTLDINVEPLALLSDKANQWPPVRWFYRLMAWMQTSQVAIATNLFQETQIYTPQSGHTLAGMIKSPVVADSKALKPPNLHPVRHLRQSRSLFQHLRCLAPQLWSKPDRTAGEGQWFDPDLHQFDLEQHDLSTFPDIQVDVQANIQADVQSETPGKIQPEIQPQIADIEQSDLLFSDWLADVPPKSPQSLSINARQIRPLTSALTSQARHDPGERAIALSETPTNSQVDGSMQPSPTWIEAKTTLVGYVKHPLEQVLEWLDIIMLWLEGAIARLWMWIKQRL